MPADDSVSSRPPHRLRVDDSLAAGPAPDRHRAVATSPRPRLSWVVPLVRNGQRQTAYQVRIATAGADPRRGGDVWDSGTVDSDRCLHLRPDVDLPAHRAFAWTVRTWDETGSPSPWAEPAPLVTGAFDDDDWTARWVEVPETAAVRSEVQLDSVPVRAVLHLTGQGAVRAYVNGEPVNADASDPSRTDQARALSRSYDVSDLVTRGANAVAVVAVRGWWRGVRDAPRIRVELVCELSDGTLVRHGTDRTWRHGSSPVVREEAFYVEELDARVGLRFAAPGFDDSSWTPVTEVATDARTAPDPGPPVRVVEVRSTKELSRPAPDVRVFDLGTNLAGRSRLRVRGARDGDRLEVVHGELLEADGRVGTTNIRLPRDRDRERQVVVHTCTGRPAEEHQTWFAFHGFRYVEVRGVTPDVDLDVEALVLHSDVPVVGRLACDEPLVERIVEAARRTQLNNLHGLPEDCPTREQAGWTGDAAASAAQAFAHLDLAGLHHKWLGDLATSQRADGGVPGVAPSLGLKAVNSDPVWGAAYQVVLREHWLHVGDGALVAEHLPRLRRWADYQLGLVEDGLVRRAQISYGHDWVALAQTPPVLLQTAAVVSSLRTLATLEDEFGHAEEAAARRAQADELTAAARAALRDPDGSTWANGTQAASAVAIAAGLEPDGDGSDGTGRAALLDAIEADIHARGDRLSSGFAGTVWVTRVLAEGGRGGRLLAALAQPEPPGVGAMLALGHGTLWETWSVDAANSGTGSLDHIGLGTGFAEWAWTSLAGLRPTAAGWSRFRVAPRPVPGVRRCEAVVETVRGTVRCAWRQHGDTLHVEVTVPVGAHAEVSLPGGTTDELGPGHHELSAPVAGLDRATVAVGAAPLGVAAGGAVRLPVALGGATAADLRWTAPSGWLAEPTADGVIVRAPAGALTDEVVPVTAALPNGARSTQRIRVTERESWLGDGVAADGWQATGTSSIEVLPAGVVCRFVPHESLPGPALLLRADAVPPGGQVLTARRLPGRDLTSACFVFAHVDLCLADAPPGGGLLVLRLTAGDGTFREATVRPLPAGWNRVSVDVAGWDGRRDLRLVEAGVRRTDEDPAHRPVAAHLSRVGWTSAPRTW